MLVQPLAASLLAGDGSAFLLFTLFWVVSSAFWIWMLVDCLTKKRLPDNEKLVWVLVMLFTHLVGALLYLVLVRSRRPSGT